MVALRGGKGLDDALRGMASKLAQPATLRAGFLEGGTYPDGTSIPFVAAINEFGNERAPPRPFFRRMIRLGVPHWARDRAALLKFTQLDGPRALGLLGEQLKGELVQSITDQVYAPLAPSTVAAKGFDTTLLETAVMKNSVDAEVKT